MKANEFRLGIWVSHNGNDILCDEGFLEVLFETKNYEVFEPKPLTEEWLLKFGFEKTGYSRWTLTGIVKLSCDFIYANGKVILSRGEYPSELIIEQITHVHQLQNLYFALTNSELQIKQTV